MIRTRTNRVVALFAVLSLLSVSGCSDTGKNNTTITPERGDVVRTVEDTGTVAYQDSYTIAPLVSGTVVECTFEEGDTVSEGQVLYVIDAGDLEDQITQARLSLNSAEAACAQAADACGDLTVCSVVSGSITAVYCHVGDFVSVGTPIAEVIDNVNLTLTVPFSPEDASGIVPGCAAAVTFSAQPETITGTVKRIYDTSSVLTGGRQGTYVEITFQNPGAIAAGTAATASVGSAACMQAGSVSCSVQQSIYATQSGQVLTLPIDVGQTVTVGETVMTIDNASITNAAVNAALARDAAAVSLSQLEDRLDDYTILAPVSGTILTRSVKKGDLTAAATPMATIAQPDTLCVKVNIDELYIDQLQPGQSASVTFSTDTGEERIYTGTVRRIDDAGVTSGGVTDYPVELTLDAMDGLKAGMNVSVSIETQRRTDCLRLPTAAVTSSTVQRLQNGKPVETAVTVGLTGGGWTEIISGLTENDQVILP